MVKLDKQQIKALSSKIHRELQEVSRENNRTINEEIEKFKKQVIKDNKILQGEEISYYAKAIVNVQYRKDIDKMQQKLKNAPSVAAIEEDIILETIDCDSMEDIIKKLKNKYK